MLVAGDGEGRVVDDGAAVQVAAESEVAGRVDAEQRQVGRVRAVRHRQRAAQVVAGLHEGRRGRPRDVRDVLEIKRVRNGKAGNQSAKRDRGIKREGAAARKA